MPLTYTSTTCYFRAQKCDYARCWRAGVRELGRAARLDRLGGEQLGERCLDLVVGEVAPAVDLVEQPLGTGGICGLAETLGSEVCFHKQSVNGWRSRNHKPLVDCV